MIKEQILKSTIALVGQEQAEEHHTLRELGYDSIDTLDFVISVEHRFDVKLPERNYADMTLSEIADVVWTENNKAMTLEKGGEA